MESRCYFAIKEGISAIQVLDHQPIVPNVNLNGNLSGKKYTISTMPVNSDSVIGFSGYDTEEATLFGQSLKQVKHYWFLAVPISPTHMTKSFNPWSQDRIFHLDTLFYWFLQCWHLFIPITEYLLILWFLEWHLWGTSGTLPDSH